MQDSTSVYLPTKLPYPLTVGRVIVHEGDVITKHSQVFTYKYADYEPVALSKEEESDESNRKMVKVEYVGNYECPFGGRIQRIGVSPGDVIKDSSSAVLEIVEPCSHPIQYGGLCAICGKAVDEEDYTGFNDKDRAPIAMAHGTTNLKVSSKEAANIEKGSTDRLLGEQKLSLVVDLDQTVIHATVDPTVGEWMSDPTNPNYEALKDVRSFSLEEPAIVLPGYNGPPPPPNIRWYFVKLRPKLHEFLEKASKLYEMHIYTMATRSYAKEIGKIIDPDGVYFGDRILSRDESGSLTQKSLKRLFPVDTSMVVVIDDRGDVWNWSPNLIKVVPYDFFVGIGDINSSFLPRQQALLGPSKRRKSVNILEEELHKSETDENDADEEEVDEENTENIRPNRKVLAAEARDEANESAIMDEDEDEDEEGGDEEEDGDDEKSDDSKEDTTISRISETTNGDIKVEDESTQKVQRVKVAEQNDGKRDGGDHNSTSNRRVNVTVTDRASSPVERMVELSEGDDNSELLAIQANERSTALEQQQHERPLAKLQQNLEKILEDEETKGSISSDTTSSGIEVKETHNLLCDDDNELEMLGQALVRIHNEFYFEVDREKGTKKTPDVKDIMMSMKSMVFKGFVFLLSGILPLGTPLDSADIVIWSKSFGATFVSEYNTSVTHVICKNPGTFKVRLAKSVDPNVKIVNPDWLFSCMSLWEKVSEDAYQVKVNSLMSKEQVDNFLKYHNHVGNGDSSTFDTSNLDWKEIDDEMREFMGDEYDELDSDDEREKQQKKGEEGGVKRSSEAIEDHESKKQKVTEDDDQYEQEILDDLADLEEDEGENKGISS
ncbi:DEKNAAC102405 [Brettanomyces naardenensis]|uniref:RNA polymerase II subunit A C-terminal domain phosphatase n=1 Tax=Brettanomyces naardenensis TaxID=13370 RepID=A0A448YKY3_BRENA|nr:DEKNAAC102405 [Brettanomyces naardenensis]